MVGDQNHVAIGGSESNDIQLNAPDLTLLGENHDLIQLVTAKELGHLHSLVASSVEHLGVVTNANSKRNIPSFEVNEPSSANKLTVSSDTIDVFKGEELEKAVHEVDSLLGIGTAPFGQERPEQGDANALVSDTKDHDVDVSFAELPVCTANTENPFGGERDEFDDGFGEKAEVKGIMA